MARLMLIVLPPENCCICGREFQPMFDEPVCASCDNNLTIEALQARGDRQILGEMLGMVEP